MGILADGSRRTCMLCWRYLIENSANRHSIFGMILSLDYFDRRSSAACGADGILGYAPTARRHCLTVPRAGQNTSRSGSRLDQRRMPVNPVRLVALRCRREGRLGLKYFLVEGARRRAPYASGEGRRIVGFLTGGRSIKRLERRYSADANSRVEGRGCA
jgi:hypothetical protein